MREYGFSLTRILPCKDRISTISEFENCNSEYSKNFQYWRSLVDSIILSNKLKLPRKCYDNDKVSEATLAPAMISKLRS